MEVLRQETEADRTGRIGMGLRFLEFFRQTEVTLARLFLGEQLRKFAETYLASARARSLGSELDRVVDALAAWELLEGHLAQRPLAVHQEPEAQASFLKLSSRRLLGTAPTICSTTLPALKTSSVGMPRTP